MSDATLVRIVVFSIFGFILLSGFIYMFDDFFGKKKKSNKEHIDSKETESV